MHGVEVAGCDVDELNRRGVSGGRERVDLGLLHGWDPTQGPKDDPVREGGRAADEIPLRDVTVVAGRQEKVFAAFALVGTCDTHVGDVTEPEVIDHAERLLGRLDHEGAGGLEVEEHGAVGGLCVGGQEVAPRVGTRLGVANLVWFGQPDAAESVAHRNQRSAGNGVEEDLDPPHEVEGIVEIGGRVRRRYSINEVEGAEGSLERPGMPSAAIDFASSSGVGSCGPSSGISHRISAPAVPFGALGPEPLGTSDCLFEAPLRQVRRLLAAVVPGSPEVGRAVLTVGLW